MLPFASTLYTLSPSASSSPSVIDSALLNMLTLLACHGRLPSLVLGLDPAPGNCGLRAVCALPWVSLAERSELWRDVDGAVEPVVLLLHRLSCPAVKRRPSSRSGVGVVLRDELLEWLPSRPLCDCNVLGLRFREPVCASPWL
jgi:hypothetical protein